MTFPRVPDEARSTGSELHKRPTWWKEATVYQIYPASFCDSNGDGIGDIQGIISKIPYLKSLGVDVVWLCPIYQSPQRDMGYDISDYRAIYPPYGTMDDWRALKRGLKEAGIRIIMDLVVNHTSDEHEWFLESRSSRDSDKRSWYYWQPPKYDEHGNRQPPNNWRSFFGAESAWEYDDATGEYYLRLFTRGQPDLNWENPKVRDAVQDIMTFWLDEGIDGFRIDAINYIAKAPGFPDAEVIEPWASHQPAMDLYLNRPKCHEYLRELGQRVLSNYDIMTVGETPHVDEPGMALQYVHPSREEFCMIFPWEHMDIDRVPGTMLGWRAFSLPDLKAIVDKWQTAMQVHGGWNSIYLENHDQGRSISRFGSDGPQFRGLSGKLLCMFLGTLSGTLYVFQGQEIGMINLPREWGIGEYTDVVSEMHYRQEKEKKGESVTEQDMEGVMDDIQKRARDHGRTPMQWSGKLPHAGFTTGKPWRKVNPDYRVCNVESAETDPESILAFWKQMLQLRKQWKTLVYGDFELLYPQHEQLFAYKRTLAGAGDALVLLNLSDQEVTLDSVLASTMDQARLLLGNYEVASDSVLRPWEARLYRI
ncbi:glycoside hydrolase superfamily [Aspergillus unguis]